jgi:pimeloyl-ACP methyl ester carboxylesterase
MSRESPSPAGFSSAVTTPGSTARDLSTNLHTMAGDSTVYMRGIAVAMVRADIPPSAPVMLVGHSLGGMTAAALAADPAFRRRFNVTQVVTAGAPIGRFEVPAGVQVLAVENRNDLVPALEGADNPDRANVTTLTFSADKGLLGKNHSLRETYAPAAADLPADDPSYAAWRESARGVPEPRQPGAHVDLRHHP